MINDFLKLLEVWRRDKLAVRSRHVYKIPERSAFVCEGRNDKMWLRSVEGPGRGKDGDGGLTARRNRCSSEESERADYGNLLSPMRRLFTQTDVD